MVGTICSPLVQYTVQHDLHLQTTRLDLELNKIDGFCSQDFPEHGFRVRGWKQHRKTTNTGRCTGRKPMEEENARLLETTSFFKYVLYCFWGPMITFRECTYIMFVWCFFKHVFHEEVPASDFDSWVANITVFFFFSGLLGDILGGITTATSLVLWFCSKCFFNGAPWRVRCFSALVLVDRKPVDVEAFSLHVNNPVGLFLYYLETYQYCMGINMYRS